MIISHFLSAASRATLLVADRAWHGSVPLVLGQLEAVSDMDAPHGGTKIQLVTASWCDWL